MTLIRKPELKVIPLPVPGDLSECLLDEAVAIAKGYPHDGSADLVVHPSTLREAMRVASVYNLKGGKLLVRVLAESRMGHDDWKLQTRGVLVTSLR